MFHQLSRQGRQSIVMTIRRARIVTPFLRGEISRVAYTQQRGEDHLHLSAGRVHCLPGVMEQDVTEAARRLLSESCCLSGRISNLFDRRHKHPSKKGLGITYSPRSRPSRDARRCISNITDGGRCSVSRARGASVFVRYLLTTG
jgi:hypothetical protein